MIVIPGGEFLMGSPPDEPERDADEGPQHRVKIARPFAVGRFEIMRGEYEAFVRETGHPIGDSCVTREGEERRNREGRNFRKPGFLQTDRHPVVCVSWLDARAYADWLSQRTGLGYRLLSEAEWEYAARAGTTTPFTWGAEIHTGLANYDGQFTYDGGPAGERRRATLPVGSFAANPFGLHDMQGNVWEWVLDCRHATYERAPSKPSAWLDEGGGDCGQRMRRGGSWDGYAKSARSANRYWNGIDFRSNYDGFRVARDLP
jgi:formylglycine-generating enzyme required for sulfatase activity